MPASVDRILAIAKAEIGYHEARSGSTWTNHQKYSPAVPGLEWSQNQAWCATFVSWCAMQAGLADLFPRTASTDYAAAWYKTRKRWSEYPAIGAQGFLGTNGDMHHTFIVTGYDDTYVYTVEGNTNTNGSPQGDGVYALKRVRRSPSIQGYGYPAYAEGIVSADPAWRMIPKPAPTPGPVRSLHTQLAPKRRVGHYDQRIRHAGGTLGDSKAGTVRAALEGYHCLDCNGHLSSDLRWVNAHGEPFNPDGLRGKFEDHTAAQLHASIPGLRSAYTTFEQNKAHGLSTEWEVKDLHPLVTDSDLTRAFARLRYAARKAYGKDWRQHVQVKVLTNLRGGLPYAKRICRFAHAAGFDTIILPRGVNRLRKIDDPSITFNRGGRV